ncbi:hypothetical protein D917_02329, partial [Trichinella nativa]
MEHFRISISGNITCVRYFGGGCFTRLGRIMQSEGCFS